MQVNFAGSHCRNCAFYIFHRLEILRRPRSESFADGKLVVEPCHLRTLQFSTLKISVHKLHGDSLGFGFYSHSGSPLFHVGTRIQIVPLYSFNKFYISHLSLIVLKKCPYISYGSRHFRKFIFPFARSYKHSGIIAGSCD